MKVVAVAGPAITAVELAAVGPDDELVVADLAGEAERARVLARAKGELRFSHDLYRETVLAGIPAAQADAVSDAKAAVERYSGPQTKWEGPTAAPKPDKGKKVVFLSGDEQNDISHLYGTYIKQAGEKLGWEVTIIDGKGSPTSWLAGMNQAIALKPDGIALFADAASLRASFLIFFSRAEARYQIRRTSQMSSTARPVRPSLENREERRATIRLRPPLTEGWWIQASRRA